MNVTRLNAAVRSLVALALLGLGTTAGAAENSAPLKDQIYLVPGVIFMGEDDEQDYNSYIAPSIGIGGQFTDRIAAELHYVLGETDTDGGGPDNDADVQSYRLDGLYFLDGETWIPYAVGGIGRLNYEPDSGSIGTRTKETQLNLGGGFMRSLTQRLSVRGDARMFYQTSTDELTPGASLAMRYVFAGPTGTRDSDGDGVSDPTDQCPTTPPGTAVDMNGCALDSDRDGVPDARDACPTTPAGVTVDSRGCARDSDRDGVADYMDDCPTTPRGDEVDARGCTIVEEKEEMISEEIELTLEFDFDSSKLRPKHYSEIERVANFMREHPNTSAQLEGHTDSRGTEAYNQALSERRAYSVRDYLIDEADIDPRRITAVGYGEKRPTASNVSDEGRQRNRRVTAIIETREMSVRPRRQD